MVDTVSKMLTDYSSHKVHMMIDKLALVVVEVEVEEVAAVRLLHRKMVHNRQVRKQGYRVELRLHRLVGSNRRIPDTELGMLIEEEVVVHSGLWSTNERKLVDKGPVEGLLMQP